MRRCVLLGKRPAVRSRASFVAATCAAVFIAVVPGAGAAGGAAQSSVAGSGTGPFAETGGPFFLSVNGRGEGPLAQGKVRGSGVYVDTFEVEGPITCMRVEDNLASIKYRFKKASGEDNGKATGGQPVDRVATEPPQPPGAFDAAASVCTDPRLNPAWTPLESGDFSVFDAG